MKCKMVAYLGLCIVLFLGFLSTTAQAQDTHLEFLTIERPPFAFQEEDEIKGFSVDLMHAISRDLDQPVNFRMVDSFAEMLGAVEAGKVDGAVANISITRAREAAMDFSLPIFRGGVQIMIPTEQGLPSIWTSIFSAELALAVMVAFALLFGGGMLMWWFERGKQPYFDRPLQDALFPSFWWALNLVVNGGFEERMPRSVLGRMFGTLLVVSSLFVVSVFVAYITASVTVKTLSGSINSISDLDGRQVGTTEGSTASLYLDSRDISHTRFGSFDALIRAFEAGALDAVVFDGPILAYYTQQTGSQYGHLLPVVFRPEDYGIALPAGSELREPINVALLELTESGEYRRIARKWFGTSEK